jgi:RimJ/RimL family protein N-acetyltransferase
MDTYKLKNGENVFLREVEKNDAKMLIEFYNTVGGETDYLSFGKDEFTVTVDFEEKYIENLKNEANSTLILAIADGKIIGAASINSGQKRRLKHVGTLGIVIKKEFCGVGLGSILINYLVNWSKSNGITKKITLITRSDNYLAIELYKKIGFEIEGTLKKDNYENGAYYDCFTMGLIL